MRDADQTARFAVITFHEKNGWGKSVPDEITHSIVKIDQENNPKLKAILEEVGWPGYKLVGKKGSDAFWLLIQHQDRDLAFQKQCLLVLEEAIRQNNASTSNLAYLTDRVRKNEGKLQVYGTQWCEENGKMSLYPVEDIDHLDERRQQMGLPSLEESKKEMIKMLKMDESSFN